MNSHSPHQTRWRWFARCLALSVAATCFTAPASQTEPSEMPSEFGLPAEGLIAGKLRSIVIPEIRLVDATVEEAMDFLRTRVFELDPDPVPQTRGLNIVVEPLAANEAVPRISLHVREIPVDEALRVITDLAGLTYQIDDFAVVVSSVGRVGPPILYTRRYRVPPDFIESALPDGVVRDPFLPADPDALRRPPTAKDVLAAQGVFFGAGARVFFDRDTSSLIVRNTRGEHDLIWAIVGDGGVEDDVGDRVEGLTAEKLRSIIIPEIRLVDATLEEAIDSLIIRVFELDPDPDPNTRGVSMVMQPGATDKALKINLDVRGIPALDALRYITELAGLTYQIDAYSVIVGPPELQRTLYTRRFQVSPDSLPIVQREITFGEGASAFYDLVTSTLVVHNTLTQLEWLDAILGGRDEETLHTRRYRVPPIFHAQAQIDTAEDILAAQGMIFGEGASAFFDRETSTLVVRNTLAQLALMEAIVE